MNKTNPLLAALAALLIAAPASAQVSLGVIGGLNIADFYGEEIDFTNRTLFGLGGVLDISLSEKAALRLEPMYLQKGAEFYVYHLALGLTTYASKAAYLEVPAFLKLALNTGIVRPYLMVGPIVGFNLSSKIEIDFLDFDISNLKVDANEATKAIDFGLGFGAGMSFPAGNNSIFVEGRYVLGLVDIVDAAPLSFIGEETAVDDVDFKTRGIQVMAGIAFHLSSK